MVNPDAHCRSASGLVARLKVTELNTVSLLSRASDRPMTAYCPTKASPRA